MEGIVGRDFVKEVTCKEPFTWDDSGDLSKPFSVPGTSLTGTPNLDGETHRLVVDFGAKRPSTGICAIVVLK